MKAKDEKEKHNTWIKGIGVTTLGWELAVPIFGGVFIGYQIDRLFDTNYIFTLVLLVVGIIMGYYNLYKHIELEILRTKVAKSHTYQEHKENGIS